MAGVDIVRKIIEETAAGADQEHVPVILLSVPADIPDRTRYLLGEEPLNPGYPISRIFRQLEAAGATVAAIPCNTAHSPPIFGLVQQQLQEAGSKLKLIHLIDETVAYIARYYPGRAAGVLSTLGTARTGIYHKALEEAGIEPVLPGEDWQHRIHAAIYDPVYGIKAQSSPVTAEAKGELMAAIALLKEKGAGVIILGCTEIPLALPEAEIAGLPLIDPNRVLARALIRFIAPEKLRNEE